MAIIKNPVTVIQSGGGGHVPTDDDPVQFWDYDGTLLYSYSVEDFLALQEMPELAQHDWAIPEGWNWTFQGAQDFVREYGACIIGETYKTRSGATELVVDIDNDTLTPYIEWGETMNMTVDWGDGSPEETFSSSTGKGHTYATTGRYTIKVDSADRTSQYKPKADYSAVRASFIFTSPQSDTDSIHVEKYHDCVKEIRFGDRITMNNGHNVFRGFRYLERFSFPNTYYGQLVNMPFYSAFPYSYKLSAFIVPNNCPFTQSRGDYSNQIYTALRPTTAVFIPAENMSIRMYVCGATQKLIVYNEPSTPIDARYDSQSMGLNELFEYFVCTRTSKTSFNRLKMPERVKLFNVKNVPAWGASGSTTDSPLYNSSSEIHHIDNLVYSDTMTTMAGAMYATCDVEYAKIPKTVTTIYGSPFGPMVPFLKTIDMSDAEAVPTLSSTLFANNVENKRLQILVPNALKSSFETTQYWSDLANYYVGV